ncbi:MAG: phage Gp37/Gp68 family protein [Tissierellia bacterium]|nr:phage Gp37/Gp68 family protein [Tissierellia bacterium]
MSLNSKIEWTENTWNPVTGCDKISDGCKNCYAHRMALRLQKMNNPRYKNGFEVTLHEDLLSLPLKWKKPSTIFVNSMGDLFNNKVPDKFIKKVFKTMNECQHHKFQVLTKYSDRMSEVCKGVKFTDNIWLGVTVENHKYKHRIDQLRQVPAKIRFISFEPLIGDIGAVDLHDIHWAIIGGESGPDSRPILEEWVLNIKEQCEEQNVAFYFKQWGGKNKKKAGRELLGQVWDEYPNVN